MANLHETLVKHRFYPLAFSSALAITLLLGRVVLSGRITLVFLAWNLTLAWIPWFCSTLAASSKKPGPMIAAGIVWIAFLPNAPYLVTDFLHLSQRAPIPLWYDIALLSCFAWSGCLLAVVSLRAMHLLVAKRFGSLVGWSFVALSAGLTGLGIYIGRFLRWNSWDLAVRPAAVLDDLASKLMSPNYLPRTFGVTLTFAALFFATYLVFEAGRSEPSDATFPRGVD